MKKVLRREDPDAFTNLISSDLDADRIDYLLRTAHHAGLPYGSVDIDYLLAQMLLDDQSRVCVTPKAIRAADHMLLCRYFDYQQVVYNKVVVGLERVLRQLLRALATAGLIDFSRETVKEMVLQEKWDEIDDSSVIEKIRRLRQQTEDSVVRAQADAVLLRKPPVVVFSEETIEDRKSRPAFRSRIKAVRGAKERMCAKFQIDARLVDVWDQQMALTKTGPNMAVDDVADVDEESDPTEQAVRILQDDGSSRTIMNAPNSLMSVLSDKEVHGVRVYALLSDGSGPKAADLKAYLRAEL